MLPPLSVCQDVGDSVALPHFAKQRLCRVYELCWMRACKAELMMVPYQVL